MVPNSVEQLLGEILGGRMESGGHLYVYGIWSSLRLDFCCGLHSMTKVLCKLLHTMREYGICCLLVCQELREQLEGRIIPPFRGLVSLKKCKEVLLV